MRERAWRQKETNEEGTGTQFSAKMRRGLEKKCRTPFVISRMWLICTITKTVVVWHTRLFTAVPFLHIAAFLVAAGCFKTLLHFCSITSNCPPHSLLHQAPPHLLIIPPSKCDILFKKEKKTSQKALALQLYPLCAFLPSPPFSACRSTPKKRAKDVERWIISPRYNLTVTLRCHLLRRTALLMSPTLHVSHFPAN